MRVEARVFAIEQQCHTRETRGHCVVRQNRLRLHQESNDSHLSSYTTCWGILGITHTINHDHKQSHDIELCGLTNLPTLTGQLITTIPNPITLSLHSPHRSHSCSHGLSPLTPRDLDDPVTMGERALASHKV